MGRMSQQALVRRNKIATLAVKNKNKIFMEALGRPREKGDRNPMALVTAYLARTAQRGAGRATVNVFTRIVAVFRHIDRVLAEAEQMRRVMARKYPHLDL